MVKQLKRLGIFLILLPIPLVVLFLLLFGAGGQSEQAVGGLRTTLTAQEVAEKANISVERAEDVIKILNYQLGREGFTLAGSSGSLAVAERESGFDPKAVNPSGGVAGYFQWSGWSNTINGDRWALASRRELSSDVELDLMSKELNGNWKKVKDYMQTATDPKEAAAYWSEHYEGVALSDGQTALEKLYENAEKWYKIFDGTIESTGAVSASGGGVFMSGVPEGWSLAAPLNTNAYIAQSYPWGQCTWYVFNRAHEMGYSFDPYMGNGGDWKYKAGYQVTNTPRAGYAVCFSPGEHGADPQFGHISIVEEVKPDGSILVSESNVTGLGVVSYRVFDAAAASQLTYVVGK